MRRSQRARRYDGEFCDYGVKVRLDNLLSLMACLARLTQASGKYEPLPRYLHISESAGSRVLVQGGVTKNFSEKSQQHLTSVVEIFDPYSELWEQRQVTGDAPSPGTYATASASLHDDLFSFGGGDVHRNTLHRLDTKMWRWCQLSTQNAEGAPMPKRACRMISFRDSLAVFGGYGIPRGPTEPQSFINDTSFTDGSGWTNEFHMYSVTEGIIQSCKRCTYTFCLKPSIYQISCSSSMAYHCHLHELRSLASCHG